MKTSEDIIDENVINLSRELVTVIADELLNRLVEGDKRYINLGVGESYTIYTDFYLEVTNSILGYKYTNKFDENLIRDFKERVFFKLNKELLYKVLNDPTLKGILKIIMESIAKAIKEQGNTEEVIN